MSRYQPMKAVLSDQPFSDPAWVFERKLDGERCGALRERGRVRLISRSGQTLNGTYPELVEALETRGPDLLVDGEVIAFKDGQTSFERLQQRMQIHQPERARRSGVAVYYYLFDILELDGRDLRGLPLRERKVALRSAVDWRGRLRFTTHRTGDGETAFREACKRGWEGVIAKRADSRYIGSRSREWRKLKCSHAQELIIGGWTEPKGSRTGLGALLLGYWEDGKLRYAGKVGTGFDRQTLESLGDELARRECPTPPFAADDLPRSARWAEPELVAQIAFSEWTRDGKLRHPRYQGLRYDKPAREVLREVASA
ncbi:MAG: non-homologous end-joining DNA ligase [Solirubrobacterales bacterium]|nr:non-homologous end-joining DNA ligase [Solirubrobacterales bacterium]MBV9164971.1 non-homologous end-joining DNA ligase [Solirubrobacterales bacterium]MBV9536115.1 non-homologous end-joining DNA ligase [Solirubrobacterales bacterium]